MFHNRDLYLNIVFSGVILKKGELRGFSGNYSKKVELRGFSGNYSKRKWSYVVFPGITLLFRENVEKMKS